MSIEDLPDMGRGPGSESEAEKEKEKEVEWCTVCDTFYYINVEHCKCPRPNKITGKQLNDAINKVKFVMDV